MTDTQNTQDGNVVAGGQGTTGIANTGTQQQGGGNPLFPTADQIVLENLKTPTGKGFSDFNIPEPLITDDKPLIDLIMKSESMKDSERQYWFNLTEVMNKEQIDKLRDILTRERQKLADIEAKYHKKKIDPVVAAAQAEEMARKRAARQAELKAKEEAAKKEEGNEEDILGELDNL